MFDLILRLRSRSLAYRRKVAFWTAVGITSIITIIWVISLAVRFGGANDPSESQVPGPFETFMGQVGGGVSSVKNLFD